ncbi:Retrovirus-related Pol polyprotein from transposon TNT 1-94 [Linum perenne]
MYGKLDKFDGTNFCRWQKKMKFFLTTIKVAYVLSTPFPDEMDTDDDDEDGKKKRLLKMKKLENDNFLCVGHILNDLADSLFDVYEIYDNASALWEVLEAKYMADDASTKKFLVSNFNSYKMSDSRSVMEQYNEFLHMLCQFAQHNLHMDEAISVSSIIDKLPPSWKNFKHMLKHKKEELDLTQLGSHLRIEENLREQEGGKKEPSSVHMMEVGESSSRKKGKKRPRNNKDTKNGEKDKKAKPSCWTCGKAGHFKRDCPTKKGKSGGNHQG